MWRYLNPLRGGMFLLDLSGVVPVESLECLGLSLSSGNPPPPSRLQKAWARVCRYWKRFVARSLRTAVQTPVSRFTIKTLDVVRKLVKPKLWKNIFKGVRAAWRMRRLLVRLLRWLKMLNKAGVLKAMGQSGRMLRPLQTSVRLAPWVFKVRGVKKSSSATLRSLSRSSDVSIPRNRNLHPSADKPGFCPHPFMCVTGHVKLQEASAHGWDEDCSRFSKRRLAQGVPPRCPSAIPSKTGRFR